MQENIPLNELTSNSKELLLNLIIDLNPCIGEYPWIFLSVMVISKGNKNNKRKQNKRKLNKNLLLFCLNRRKKSEKQEEGEKWISTFPLFSVCSSTWTGRSWEFLFENYIKQTLLSMRKVLNFWWFYNRNSLREICSTVK